MQFSLREGAEVKEVVKSTKKKKIGYNFKMGGIDWYLLGFTKCNRQQQAPINLLSPITPYGQSYKFYQFADDVLVIEYTTL